MHKILDDPEIGLANLSPTPKQKQAAFAAATLLLVAFCVVAPFAATPLPRIDAFIPSINFTIFATDLITSVLLFAQFSIYRSRALLILASGYLFTALIVIPHALTFPGAFSPTGLLGAGPQSTAWLYIFWHLGFPTALLLYVWLKDTNHTQYRKQSSIRSRIGWTVAITISLVCGLSWVVTAGHHFLPRFFLDTTRLTLLGRYTPTTVLLFCALALASLWTRRRSLLDLWLMVVACALIGELALTVIRFSLGFYVSRIFSLVTSTTVLIVLLVETTRLYANLARSNMALQRERQNKLMNLAALVASISHEVRQPLAAIAMQGGAGLRFLEHAPPDLEEVRSAFNAIVRDSHRTSEVFDNFRALFGHPDQGKEQIDVNEIALEALHILRGELKDHGITTRVELTPDLPLVMGHSGQLQEVILNLVHNAIEAMDAIRDRSRVLRVITQRRDHDTIIVAVEDTGPGIPAEQLHGIFDAFATTKRKGMGLGLAICRMIVESHGGRLSAQSDEKRRGALFQFTLPINSAAG